MGSFDTYRSFEEGVQLKTGPCRLYEYTIGDEVPLDDGVYWGNWGLIFVSKGTLLGVLSLEDPEDVREVTELMGKKVEAWK